MPSWFPIVVLVAAIGLTYLLCIRPMRRGQCGPTGGSMEHTDQARREEIDRLHEEIAQARQELGLRSDSPGTRHGKP